MSKPITISVLSLCLLWANSAWSSTYPLENILPENAAKSLAKVGIMDSAQLFEKGSKPAARKKLAKDTSIAVKQLTEWIRMCDLLRIKGIGPVMVKLLNACKVSSVAQLRQRKAKNLYDAIIKANDKAKITEKTPSEKHLENWIEQAKKLKILVQ